MEEIINVQEKKDIAFQHLSEIIKIFQSKGIDYWLEYGTLLGAVREQTNIPWDSEFDLGIWYQDFEKNKTSLFQSFSEIGFEIFLHSKDRVKLVHKDIQIGAFNFDIHTYHLNEDTAYVSFNKRVKSFTQTLLYNLFRAFKMVDTREKTVYYLGVIIRSILPFQENIPEYLSFKKGKYNSTESFSIIIDDKIYDYEKEYLNKIGTSGRLGIQLAKHIPSRLRIRMTDYLTKKNNERLITNEIQAIPADYFKNLTTLPFEKLNVSVPKKYEEYLKLVYGDEWHVPKPHWTRNQNKINTNL